MKDDTKNDSTMYLVQEELALFTPAVYDKWQKHIKMEELTAYETHDQLDARMRAVSYDKFPKLKAKIDGYADQILQGKKPAVDFRDFPEDAVDIFLFSIGASGISALIDLSLRDQRVLESHHAMMAIGALSRARHKILEKNAAVFSK